MSSKTRITLCMAAMVCSVLSCGCTFWQDTSSGSQAAGAGTTDQVDLNIADRWQDPVNTPDEGWCGEACIQEAMAYYGQETSQVAIHQAANTPQPDIDENTMDTALDNLGVSYVAWDTNDYDVAALVAWIQTALRNGHPVICGLKIYPDETPTWYVDHFVLAVGFDTNGLILNTQLDNDGQISISYAELSSRQLAQDDYGYAFVNNQRLLFAREITGFH